MAVDLSFYTSYLAEEVRDKVRADERDKVRAEERDKVRAEERDKVRAEGRTEDLLLVLEQRGLDISGDVRRRITDCHDPETLRQWLSRAVTAPKAEDIFEDA